MVDKKLEWKLHIFLLTPDNWVLDYAATKQVLNCIISMQQDL